MGGDGTAGWILSCLDAMQEKRALLPDPQIWSPPPVAVIPLGTGSQVLPHPKPLSAPEMQVSSRTVSSAALLTR